MNKRFLKRTISLMLSVVALITVACFGVANTSAAEVFPEDEVKALLAQAELKPVVNAKDKQESRSICTFSTKSPENVYPTRKGTILVATDSISGHAAIVYDENTVIESVVDGVVVGKNDWNITRETLYGIDVNDTTLEEDEIAADWCLQQVGKKYNWNFFNIKTREKFYCSQLVWAAFYDNFDIDLSTDDFGTAIYPAELVTSEKTSVVYSK